jgi:hypothetical protein
VPDVHHILAKVGLRRGGSAVLPMRPARMPGQLSVLQCAAARLARRAAACGAAHAILDGPAALGTPPAPSFPPPCLCRVAACSATPSRPQPAPSCAACMKPSHWPSSWRQRGVPATTGAAQVRRCWEGGREWGTAAAAGSARCCIHACADSPMAGGCACCQPPPTLPHCSHPLRQCWMLGWSLMTSARRCVWGRQPRWPSALRRCRPPELAPPLPGPPASRLASCCVGQLGYTRGTLQIGRMDRTH